MLTQDVNILPRQGAYFRDSETFFSKFTPLMESTTTSVVKLESRQDYQEPGNPSFEALKSGDERSAIDKLWETRHSADRENCVSMCRKGISWTRIRLVERPLTDYTRWELHSYDISVRYGERILIVDITGQPASSPIRRLSDFLIFDGKAVMAHDYDSSGLIKGGWVIDTPEQVRRYADAIALCMKTAVPLGVFEWEQKLR
jgi:hypothetical protein